MWKSQCIIWERHNSAENVWFHVSVCACNTLNSCVLSYLFLPPTAIALPLRSTHRIRFLTNCLPAAAISVLIIASALHHIHLLSHDSHGGPVGCDGNYGFLLPMLQGFLSHSNGKLGFFMLPQGLSVVWLDFTFLTFCPGCLPNILAIKQPPGHPWTCHLCFSFGALTLAGVTVLVAFPLWSVLPLPWHFTDIHPHTELMLML